MVELIVKKRDNIPTPTILAWFNDFKKRGWTKQKFDEQFQKVIDGTTYGVVKIDDFLKEEKTYTEKEANDFAERKISQMISDANALMKHYNIEIELEFDVPVHSTQIKVAVAKKLLPLLQRVERETNLGIIDEAFDIACENLELNIIPNEGKKKTKIKEVL